jgi:hypothetical protein
LGVTFDGSVGPGRTGEAGMKKHRMLRRVRYTMVLDEGGK